MPRVPKIPTPGGLTIGRRGGAIVLTIGDDFANDLAGDIDDLYLHLGYPSPRQYAALHTLRLAFQQLRKSEASP